MKFQKTIAVMALIAGSILASTALQAQEAPKEKPPGAQGAPGVRRPNIDQTIKNLELTEEQSVKFKAAWEEQMKAMRDLRSDTNSTPEQKREKAKALREANTAKVKAILTPEQFEKYQKSQPGQRPRPGAGAAAPAPEEKAKKE